MCLFFISTHVLSCVWGVGEQLAGVVYSYHLDLGIKLRWSGLVANAFLH